MLVECVVPVIQSMKLFKLTRQNDAQIDINLRIFQVSEKGRVFILLSIKPILRPEMRI